MAVRKGLGRGLDLLIPKDESMPKNRQEKIKIHKKQRKIRFLHSVFMMWSRIEISQENNLMKMPLRS